MALQGCSLATAFMRRVLHTAPVTFQTAHPPNYFHFLQTLKQLNQSPRIPDLLEHEIITLTNSSSNLYWSEIPISAECTDELKPYRRAISQITEHTITKYCADSASILEVGSGTFPITELLSNLPKSIKSRIDLSDISENRLHFLQKHYPQTHIQNFDILSGRPADHIYERVVMTDVLNLFSRDQLETALKNISNILCPGGILIHFSIREALFNHTLDEFSESGSLFFPIFGSTWKDAYIIGKSDLKNWIGELKADYAPLKEILTEYLYLSHTERVNLCLEHFANNEVGIFQEIVNCLEKFRPPNIQRISFEEHYQSRLKRTAGASGFNVLESQEKEAYFIGPRSEDLHRQHHDINLFATDRLLRRMECSNREFSPELVQEESRIHVMAIQKPPSL